MIIPWQDLDPETLDNLIESFVLREGTDYGEHERSLADKVAGLHRNRRLHQRPARIDFGRDAMRGHAQ